MNVYNTLSSAHGYNLVPWYIYQSSTVLPSNVFILLLRSDRTNEYSMALAACCLMFVLMFPQAVFSSVFYFASVPLYQGFLIIGWVCESWWLICTRWNLSGISAMCFRQLWHLRIAEGFVSIEIYGHWGDIQRHLTDIKRLFVMSEANNGLKRTGLGLVLFRENDETLHQTASPTRVQMSI